MRLPHQHHTVQCPAHLVFAVLNGSWSQCHSIGHSCPHTHRKPYPPPLMHANHRGTSARLSSTAAQGQHPDPVAIIIIRYLRLPYNAVLVVLPRCLKGTYRPSQPFRFSIFDSTNTVPAARPRPMDARLVLEVGSLNKRIPATATNTCRQVARQAGSNSVSVWGQGQVTWAGCGGVRRCRGIGPWSKVWQGSFILSALKRTDRVFACSVGQAVTER